MSLTEEWVSLLVGDKDESQRMRGHGRPSTESKQKQKQKQTRFSMFTMTQCEPLDSHSQLHPLTYQMQAFD